MLLKLDYYNEMTISTILLTHTPRRRPALVEHCQSCLGGRLAHQSCVAAQQTFSLPIATASQARSNRKARSPLLPEHIPRGGDRGTIADLFRFRLTLDLRGEREQEDAEMSGRCSARPRWRSAALAKRMDDRAESWIVRCTSRELDEMK